MYMLIGSPGETPRYYNFKNLDNKILRIGSTQKNNLYFEIKTNFGFINVNEFWKQFKEYIKTMPQHVKASMWANDKLDTNITHTDNPYLFYIKSNCEDDLKIKDRAVAVCLNEEDLPLIDKRSDIFEIDYDIYFRKQVLEQFEELRLIDGVSEILERFKPKPKKKVEKQLILFN